MSSNVDTDYIISQIFILLVSIGVGMVIALMIRETDMYHGPNANAYSRKIFYSKKTGKCYHFVPNKLECPKPHTRFDSIFEKITTIRKRFQ
jgi:hypothetical protein